MIPPHHSKIAPLLVMFSPQNSHSWKPAIQGLDMTLWFSNPLTPWPSKLFISEVFEGMQNIHELRARIFQPFSGVHPLIHTSSLLFSLNQSQDKQNIPKVTVHTKKLNIVAPFRQNKPRNVVSAMLLGHHV